MSWQQWEIEWKRAESRRRRRIAIGWIFIILCGALGGVLLTIVVGLALAILG
jgi:hypothetical protein